MTFLRGREGGREREGEGEGERGGEGEGGRESDRRQREERGRECQKDYTNVTNVNYQLMITDTRSLI